VSLREHGLDHETCIVDLQNKPENFTALYLRASSNAQASAKVPILEINDDTVLIESAVICDYLDDLVGSKCSAADRANARLFATLFQPAMGYINILKAEPGSQAEAQAVEKLREGMRAMNGYLSAHGRPDGPFLLGNEWTSAESNTAPFATRFSTVLPGLRPSVDPQRLMEEDGLDALQRWMGAVCSRESCVSTTPPADELVASYAKLVERMKSIATP